MTEEQEERLRKERQLAVDAARKFERTVLNLAEAELLKILGEEAGRREAAKVALQFRTLAARHPLARQATPESVALCVALCAITGLSVGGPYPGVDLIPRRTKSGVGLNWQLGFRGALRLVQRAGTRLDVLPQWRGLGCPIDPATGTVIPEVVFATTEKNADTLIGVWVVGRDIATGQVLAICPVSAQDILDRRACSDAWKRNQHDPSTPWNAWFPEMAMKTAIKYTAARGFFPLDPVAEYALEADMRADAPTVYDVSGEEREPAALPEPPPDLEPEPEPEAGYDRVLAHRGELFPSGK